MNNSSWLILTLLSIIMLSHSSAEIIHSVINLTYEGNFENEEASDIALFVEMPLTDETQKILKIYSDKNWSVIIPERKKEIIKIDVGSANNYSLNFIVEKKFYEIKFNNKNEYENVQNFLSNTGNVSWDEEIKKKAEEIIAEIDALDAKVSDAIKAFKIAKFVHNSLTYDRNSKDLSAKDVFASKRATCMGYTNLFIAMCRSVGIPARAVGGIAFTNRGFERHSYAEIFINGQWIPIDPTFLQFPADASHIAIYKDNEARGISVELEFVGKNVLHTGNIGAKFITRKDENLINGRIINKNLTGKNSIMPINVELTNTKNFYVFGVCKISSKLETDATEKIFYLLPYEKKNITFKIFIPEHEEKFLYFYNVGVRCNNLNLTTNFTVDGHKTGNIYDGVVIENIDIHLKEIRIKNLNEESENIVNVSIIVQSRNKTISESKTIIIEKGADRVFKYNIEYPDENFILMVKCVGKNFSDNRKIVVNVRSETDQNFIMENLWLIVFGFLIIMILIYLKFLK